MIPKLAASGVAKQITSTFPDFGVAITKPLTDVNARNACYSVLDILLNAKATKDEIRTVATYWSLFSNETGDFKQSIEVFDRLLQHDRQWTEVIQAKIRLLLHMNKPVQALRLFESGLQAKETHSLIGLHGLCYLKTDTKKAEQLLLQAKDYINLAACYEMQGLPAEDLWKQALELNPSSLAALNGSKRYGEVIKKEQTEVDGGQSEFDARVAQALTSLGMKARDELFAVTAEGLFRSSIANLERSSATGKKPAYGLELSRALDEYAKLLKKWDKREGEAQALQTRAKQLRDSTSSFLPSFTFDLGGWRIE
jgi:hypothetical protein